jgi:hypothetical protein
MFFSTGLELLRHALVLELVESSASVPGQWWPHLRKVWYRVKIFFIVWTNDNAFIVNSSYGFCRIFHYCRTHLWHCFTSWNISIIRRVVMYLSLLKKWNI